MQCSKATARKKQDPVNIVVASNSKKLTRFKIAADNLIAFAGEFFTAESL